MRNGLWNSVQQISIYEKSGLDCFIYSYLTWYKLDFERCSDETKETQSRFEVIVLCMLVLSPIELPELHVGPWCCPWTINSPMECAQLRKWVYGMVHKVLSPLVRLIWGHGIGCELSPMEWPDLPIVGSWYYRLDQMRLRFTRPNHKLWHFSVQTIFR